MTVPRALAATAIATLLATQIGACGSRERSHAGPAAEPPATTTAVVIAVPAAPPRPPPRPPRARRRTFAFESRPLPPSIQERITGSSWHTGCPVALDRLRYIKMDHWGFDGRLRHGEMIVDATVVSAVRGAFRRLFAARFPVRRMHLVDDYGADDYRSIEADNTSSFNCRRATGSTRWSEHAYGRAIDINPIENPYVYANGTTSHPASRPYLDRSRNIRGIAREGGVLVKAFDAVGWGWGGRWSPATDLQHFSATGS
jgi:hypothetical protein